MSERQVNGLALRAMRLRAGLSTSDLAERSGLSEGTIEGIEAGRRKYLADATITGLAGALKMDVLKLMEEILIVVKVGEKAGSDERAERPAI
ncbi:MAG: helix-turn-helix domain-containing protein [Vicinamibacteria bacterium]